MRFAGLVLFVAIVFTIGFLANRLTAEHLDSLVISTGSSVLASLLMIVAGWLFFKSYKSPADRLEEMVREFEERSLNGVLRIKGKYADGPGFWLSLLAESSSRLDLAGHKLATWKSEEYRERFIDALTSLARAKKTVRILVTDIDPDETIKRTNSVDVWDLHELLYNDIVAKLPERFKDYIELKTTNGRDKLKYMLVVTDQRTVMASYFCKMPSRECMVLTLANGSRYATTLRDDFDKIYKESEQVRIGPVGEPCRVEDKGNGSS